MATKELEVSDFQSDVIEASHQKPVVVDFWAPWCGPCRTLGPRLEALASEQADKWSLVKINTDEHPELARRYGIRGIPAVKLFVEGEVVDEFTGVMPRHAIERWLEEALPTESKKRLDAAQQALEEGDDAHAEELLRTVLQEESENDEAQVLLARTLVFRAPEEAQKLADGANVAAPDLLQTKEAVQTLARLLLLDEDALPEKAGREAYAEATEALRRQDFDTALQHFIEVIRENRYYDDDGARKACVALFALLGNDHPAVRAHRRTFDMALY